MYKFPNAQIPNRQLSKSVLAAKLGFAGLKYTYLLIIGDYSVRVEEPKQLTNLTNTPLTNKPII